MKERPILMSAPMALASLDGSKTQTRRIVKWSHPAPGLNLGFSGLVAYSYVPGVFSLESQRGDGAWESRSDATVCPYGRPGDRLWVRETFFAFGRWETRFSKKKGRDEWHFVDMTLESGHSYICAADGVFPAPMAEGWNRGGTTPMWWKRPAIFMPRAASRKTLENTGVRVQRLQGISYEDAIAEGMQDPSKCPPLPDALGLTETVEQYARRKGVPQRQYRQLWDVLNGPESWEANPWVWVVSFRRV